MTPSYEVLLSFIHLYIHTFVHSCVYNMHTTSLTHGCINHPESCFSHISPVWSPNISSEQLKFSQKGAIPSVCCPEMSPIKHISSGRFHKQTTLQIHSISPSVIPVCRVTDVAKHVFCLHTTIVQIVDNVSVFVFIQVVDNVFFILPSYIYQS